MLTSSLIIRTATSVNLQWLSGDSMHGSAAEASLLKHTAHQVQNSTCRADDDASTCCLLNLLCKGVSPFRGSILHLPALNSLRSRLPNVWSQSPISSELAVQAVTLNDMAGDLFTGETASLFS